MRTYIKVNTPLRQDLMSIFGLSRRSIYKALNGLVNTPKSEKIRQYALAHGGEAVSEIFVPKCKTAHAEDGSFVQIFAGGIAVWVNTKDSTARITQGSKELESFGEVTLNKWSSILRMAQDYADGKYQNKTAVRSAPAAGRDKP